MLKELERIVTSAFASGATVLYYESLWGANLNFVNAHNISPSMLKEYLMVTCPWYYFAEDFMAKTQLSKAEAITQNIQRVWGETPLESAEALSERLPYIPAECISNALSAGSLFMRADGGKYLRLDRFFITDDEKNAAISFVMEHCMEQGFCTLQDIPLGSIEEKNDHLSQKIIYNALYKSILAENVALKGVILTLKGADKVDAATLLKRYINGREQCTFSELMEEAKKINDQINKQNVFRTLYDNMVRVSKDVFVAKSLVQFSVKDIDAILQSLITDHFISIRSVTTFALFPPCGYAWNHYVLGSFCYKYSSKYCLHVPAFNDKNAGIIAERDFNKTYDEMLALALLRDHVELEPKAAGQYFSSMGYKARNPYDELENVVARALELRQGE